MSRMWLLASVVATRPRPSMRSGKSRYGCGIASPLHDLNMKAGLVVAGILDLERSRVVGQVVHDSLGDGEEHDAAVARLGGIVLGYRRLAFRGKEGGEGHLHG